MPMTEAEQNAIARGVIDEALAQDVVEAEGTVRTAKRDLAAAQRRLSAAKAQRSALLSAWRERGELARESCMKALLLAQIKDSAGETHRHVWAVTGYLRKHHPPVPDRDAEEADRH
ncbi:MAG: hypothetical protein DLM56_09875 [Pseudonocardiales bacterium]|nr:MAG: hypothetical protein DLM56_09875 [Pseudonocardiales bacterium]